MLIIICKFENAFVCTFNMGRVHSKTLATKRCAQYPNETLKTLSNDLVLYCQCCNQTIGTSATAAKRHVEATKHKNNREAWDWKKAQNLLLLQQSISDAFYRSTLIKTTQETYLAIQISHGINVNTLINTTKYLKTSLDIKNGGNLPEARDS